MDDEQRKEKQRAYYAKNRESILAKRRDRKREHDRVYRAKNRAKLAAYNKKYHVENRKAINVRQLGWQRNYRAENRERLNAQARARYAANPDAKRERARERNRPRRVRTDAMRAKQRRHRKANPEIYAAYHRKRKGLKLGAAGVCTADKARQRSAVFGHRCYLCNAPSEAMDHVKPLSKGGSNWPSNLRPICWSCNSTKRDKWPYPVPSPS